MRAILGRPVGDLDVRRRIGYLPENPYFYDYLTAEELLTYFAGLFGLPAAERAPARRALLDQVGLGAERRMQLRKFSKGMVQRVGIAQALVNDPEVVFLDEPMSGLDPLGRRDIRALILRLRDAGKTVFFSSHILSDAETLCSRVAIVAGGRLATSGRLSDIAGYEVRGWEVVMADVSPALLATAPARASSATPVSDGRVTSSCRRTRRPSLHRRAGGRRRGLVSVNPLHTTLEEMFVRQVAGDASAREGALLMQPRTLGANGRGGVPRDGARPRALQPRRRSRRW